MSEEKNEVDTAAASLSLNILDKTAFALGAI